MTQERNWTDDICSDWFMSEAIAHKWHITASIVVQGKIVATFTARCGRGPMAATGAVTASLAFRIEHNIPTVDRRDAQRDLPMVADRLPPQRTGTLRLIPLCGLGLFPGSVHGSRWIVGEPTELDALSLAKHVYASVARLAIEPDPHITIGRCGQLLSGDTKILIVKSSRWNDCPQHQGGTGPKGPRPMQTDPHTLPPRRISSLFLGRPNLGLQAIKAKVVARH
ncbi:MAG: hypothetical protein ACKVP3_17340 [Hyphomicrobiaceae bacterium]